MTNKDEEAQLYVIFIAFVFLIICLSFFIIYFIVSYRKKQIKNLHEKEELKSRLKQELLKAKLEIQEQTLNHVAREIHDNIGQVLSFLKLNLSTLRQLSYEELKAKLDESKELVSHVINDLRDLSKSLSMEQISVKGLVQTLTEDVERMRKAGLFDIALIVAGKPFPIDPQRELVLFRIFQESVNNCIKHSNAKELKISLLYSTGLFNLTVQDDGSGFAPDDGLHRRGSGLTNMQNRAKMIGAELVVNSSPGKGCQISVSLDPSQQHAYADGNHSSSPN